MKTENASVQKLTKLRSIEVKTDECQKGSSINMKVEKKRMPVIIEFVGAGGAGKSHVCRELLKKYLNRDIHDAVIANHHKVSVKDIFAYSVLNVRTLITVFLFLRKPGSEVIRRKAAIFIEIIVYLVRRDYLFPNKKIILFDQGIMQILRVLERKSDGVVAVHNLDKTCQKLFFKDIGKLVIVEVDSEIVMHRRIQRGTFMTSDRECFLAKMNDISSSMKKTYKDAEFVRDEWGVRLFTYVNHSDDVLDEVYNFVKP